MTEFETIEAINLNLDMAVTASMNFVTILIAYLVAAFVAGRKIPSGVAVGTTLIYSLFQTAHLIGTIAHLETVYRGVEFMRSTYPDSWAIGSGATVGPGTLTMLFVLPMLLAWLGSLYYMHFHARGGMHSE